MKGLESTEKPKVGSLAIQEALYLLHFVIHKRREISKSMNCIWESTAAAFHPLEPSNDRHFCVVWRDADSWNRAEEEGEPSEGERNILIEFRLWKRSNHKENEGSILLTLINYEIKVSSTSCDKNSTRLDNSKWPVVKVSEYITKCWMRPQQENHKAAQKLSRRGCCLEDWQTN